MASYIKPKTTKEPKTICQNKACTKMGRFQPVSAFYKSRVTGVEHHPFCKTCLDATIDTNNLDTVYVALKSLDTPFIMDEWDKTCVENDRNIFDRYITRINKLQKYKSYHWADSVFDFSEEALAQEDLSDMAKKYIEEKTVWSDEWYGNYSPTELKYLNEYYESLKKDFKIVTRNHQDYARKIAQASLAMNKAYDTMLQLGDKESADKYKLAASTFDSLSKSAQFSESSRSANDVSLGSFGVVFDRVERHEWVPEYKPAKDEEDVYDKLIRQFSNIKRSL